ncbi:MAG: Crp/Fnr family transcriptional regulator [Acidiferrobacteraceae bacterium]
MNRNERRLLAIFREIPDEQQSFLLAFAEFLEARSRAERPVSLEPVPIPVPENETVVKAIKRLSATYPMLDRSRVFNDTSSLMMQHVAQGRPAVEVIAELEALFQRLYDDFVKENRD